MGLFGFGKKKGMTRHEIYVHIKPMEPEKRGEYLSKILKKTKLLTPGTAKYARELMADSYMKAGKEAERGKYFALAAEMYKKAGVPKEKSFMQSAKDYEEEGALGVAALMYERAGTKEAFMKAGEIYEKSKDYADAARMYIMAGMPKDEVLKKLKELEGKKEKYNKNDLEKLIASVMLLAGIGLLFSLYFSKPQMIGNMPIQQLAPPMPNYQALIFIFCIIAGSIYFLIKLFRKRRYSIPLSFR